jgi:KDO2-lipid IV(A) lauroyltransferase
MMPPSLAEPCVRRKQSFITAWVPYLILRAFVGIVRLLGVRISLWIAAGIGRVFFFLDLKHRRRALEHLLIAFPEWDQSLRVAVARRSFANLVQLAVEIIFTPAKIHQGNYQRHLQRKNPEPGLSMLRERRPMLLVSGHFGNWEALGYLLAVEGHAITAVARPLDHDKINAWLVGQRTARGMAVIEKFDDANSKIMTALQSNRAVGFIADQNGGDLGVYVPFFGRLASTSKAVGLLAQQFKVPVLVGSACRVERYGLRYEIELIDVIQPEEWSDHPDPMYYITARYVRAIETAVRARPEQYMWMHRRWKSRPKFEVQGKPFPESLERKLRSLPWMTEEMIARLKS